MTDIAIPIEGSISRKSLTLFTGRMALAQVMLCQGCCCGRVDRGFPPVPVELIKEWWREHKLNRTVQLTVSGCLGPCHLANVIAIALPSGMEWYGGLFELSDYERLCEWARDCHRQRCILARPKCLEKKRFIRFSDAPAEPSCGTKASESKTMGDSP